MQGRLCRLLLLLSLIATPALLGGCVRAKPPRSRPMGAVEASPESTEAALASSPTSAGTRVAQAITSTPPLLYPEPLTDTPAPTPSHTPTLGDLPSATAGASATMAPATPTSTPTVDPTVLALTPTSTDAPSPVPTGDLSYTIVQGDSLISIADRFGSTPKDIQAKNGIIDPNTIYVGQQLTIPVGYTPSETAPPPVVVYTIKQGDTLSGLARRYRTTVSEILAENPGTIADKDHLVPGTTIRIPLNTATPAPAPLFHTVRRGESISSIASRYGVSMWALVQANPMPNPNRLYVGQVLRIPR